MNLIDKQLIFIDLDDTLIKTVSGCQFPVSITDMQFNIHAVEALQNLAYHNKLKAICIVSNQGGIEKGYVSKRDFEVKFEAVRSMLERSVAMMCLKPTPVYAVYCPSNDANCPDRKPNTRMLSNLQAKLADEQIIDTNLPKHTMLMIGDASGKPGDFSDSDAKTAENYGIDYLDVDDFIKAMKEV